MERRCMNVLLVEDDDDQARLILDMLKRASDAAYEVVRVSNLREAVLWLNKASFDVLLTDLGLPDSHGLATFVRLRVASPDLPILVLTACDDEALARAALRRGAQDYLIKGHVTPRMLSASVRYAVERHRLLERSARVTETLLDAERDRVVEETAGGVAQEINQPLTVVSVVADHLAATLDRSHPDYDLILSLQAAAERIDRAVKAMRHARKYVTKPYTEYADILDLEAAAKDDGPTTSSGTRA